MPHGLHGFHGFHGAIELSIAYTVPFVVALHSL